MSYFIVIISILFFIYISYSVKYHFISNDMPLGMKLISGLSFINFIAFIYLIYQKPTGEISSIIGIILILCAIFIFEWAKRTTGKNTFRLAFNEETPEKIVQMGPYQYIRHPFYTSYILFWLAFAILTMHPINIILCIFLCITYWVTAKKEEAIFLNSSHRDDYRNYIKKTGLFFPFI